jgi:mono/diheme cytochrome c family protein
LLLAVVTLAACGADRPDADPDSGASASASGPSAAELERGIGPVRQVTLLPVDPALAAQGQTTFEMKCTACHKLGERYVGPPLGAVLERRTPEFVMNMMLNPSEMTQKHPVIRELVGEYMLAMPFQDLTEPEARAILEYLRTVQTGAVQ